MNKVACGADSLAMLGGRCRGELGSIDLTDSLELGHAFPGDEDYDMIEDNHHLYRNRAEITQIVDLL